MKRRGCGWNEDFLLEGTYRNNALVAAGPDLRVSRVLLWLPRLAVHLEAGAPAPTPFQWS